jgi:hypothetical protein
MCYKIISKRGGAEMLVDDITKTGRVVGTPAPGPRRRLKEAGFVRIDGLPNMGEEESIVAYECDYGKWAVPDSGCLVATTLDGEVWVAKESADATIRQEQLACLRQICPRGIASHTPEWSMIPNYYILGRVLDPDWDPDPRHAVKP